MQIASLGEWLDGLPALRPPPPEDEAAVERGRALFHDARQGCSGCHGGRSFTNSTNQDVGTGGRFQVPTLIGVGYRFPVMHDGGAASLASAGVAGRGVGRMEPWIESVPGRLRLAAAALRM